MDTLRVSIIADQKILNADVDCEACVLEAKSVESVLAQHADNHDDFISITTKSIAALLECLVLKDADLQVLVPRIAMISLILIRRSCGVEFPESPFMVVFKREGKGVVCCCETEDEYAGMIEVASNTRH